MLLKNYKIALKIVRAEWGAVGLARIAVALREP